MPEKEGKGVNGRRPGFQPKRRPAPVSWLWTSEGSANWCACMASAAPGTGLWFLLPIVPLLVEGFVPLLPLPALAVRRDRLVAAWPAALLSLGVTVATVEADAEGWGVAAPLRPVNSEKICVKWDCKCSR